MMFEFSILLVIILSQSYDFAELDTEEWNVFSYPPNAKSERDLQACKERQVCSIVHRRFWFPRQVERLCRCETNECPSTWSEETDNFTMAVSNRAQMKFCEPVSQLPTCLENGTGLLHIENQTISQNSEFTATAGCYCPPHRKWVENRRFGNSSSNYHAYRCSKLPKCNADELCGLERVDNYEVYYQCSCPTGTLCTRTNNTEWPVELMFYSGMTFKAVCTKYPEIALNFVNNVHG